MSEKDYTPYQQKIIKRYYQNREAIKLQQLAEKVAELYLADGKKRDRLWKQVAETLTQLKFPDSRVQHLMEKRDPALLAGVLQELNAKSS